MEAEHVIRTKESNLRLFVSGSLAGFLIGIGSTVMKSVNDPVAGALLFCIGLYSIVYLHLHLFTGKIGGIISDAVSDDDLRVSAKLLRYAIIFLGNFVGAYLCATLISCAFPQIASSCLNSCTKYVSENMCEALLFGAMCGVLMEIAVSLKGLAIFLCVPAFILSGYEHSIAEMFYFSAAHMITAQSICHILLVGFGNAIGAILIHEALHFINRR